MKSKVVPRTLSVEEISFDCYVLQLEFNIHVFHFFKSILIHLFFSYPMHLPSEDPEEGPEVMTDASYELRGLGGVALPTPLLSHYLGEVTQRNQLNMDSN